MILNIDMGNNKIMKILICEDELIIAEYIKQCCLEQGFQVVGVACNQKEAQALLAMQKPDLALLDINMDEPLAGVKIAQQLQAQHPDTLHFFITAFSDLSTIEAAIKTKPQSYLVKPLDKETLVANLFLAKFKLANQVPKTEILVDVETETGVKSLDVSRIAYVGADANYCEFVDINRNRTIERTTLSSVENAAAKYLTRIHKSFLVNLNHVARFNSQRVVLNNSIELPVGRKYKQNMAI